MAAKTVQALLDDIRLLGNQQYSLVESVRTLVKKNFPLVSEEVKYGGILFSSGVQFCGVFAYSAHVTMEFGRGAELEDTHGMLEGNGKFRRHIKLQTLADIESKHLKTYIAQALRLSTKPSA